MVQTVIRSAISAQELATDLIDDHHEHLQRARILWLFTNSKRTRGNRVVLGTSNRTNALQRYLSSGNVSVEKGSDFIVLIDSTRWETSLKTQREAMVDHLLCRMQLREVVNKRSGKITHTWTTVAPDIEEFTDVILRHGVWLPEQQRFVKAIQQGRQLTLETELPDLTSKDEDTEDTDTEDGTDPAAGAAGVGAESGTQGAVQAASVAADAVAPPPPNGHTAMGNEELPGPTWQQQTGAGSSDLEQHRQRLGRTGAAQAPTP